MAWTLPHPLKPRHLLWGAAVLLLLPVVVLLLMLLWHSRDLPPLDEVLDYKPRQHLQVFTSDGVEIAQFGSERRLYVPLAKTPKLLQDAVVAVEDHTFREHGGISPRGVLRALWANTTGGLPQGASTITQQVARTFFLSTRRTAERKLKEALLTYKIEARLSKDQILELYLNQIYLGQRSYGYAAAAQTYFGKRLEELDVAETAMLAGLQQNPIHANPIVNFDRAKQRQKVVLLRMRETGVIDEATRLAAVAQPLVLRRPGSQAVVAQHVADMARQAVVERLGEKAAYTEGIRVVTTLRAAEQQAAHLALRKALLAHEARQPWRGPEDFEKLPADDAEAEKQAAQLLREHTDDEDLRVAVVLKASPAEVMALLANGETVRITGNGLRLAAAGLKPGATNALAVRRGAVVRVVGITGQGAALPNTFVGGTGATAKAPTTTWALVQWPQAEAAYVALSPEDGRVRALVGGFDFHRRNFNHATQAWRQPGSSFKPFVYAAALENGVAPDTLVDDTPFGNGEPGSWNPQNSDGKFDGPISVREAMARSKNMVCIRLLEQTGIGPTLAWAEKFGFDRRRHPDNLTLALGAGSTTPLQLATAYAVLANGGYKVQPVLIERITDAQGQTLYQAPEPAPLDEAQRVVPARNVFLVNSLLNEVTRSGTAARAQATLQRPDLYGKTGTTNDAVDAWFAGFQPSRVGVAWMGHPQPRSLGEGETGGGLALPIWLGAMATALKGVPVQALVPPSGVVWTGQDWHYTEAGDEAAPAAAEAASAASAAAPAAEASAPR
ncbi:MAG: penicillin-binding protein 1A [Rubrivivax sp.]